MTALFISPHLDDVVLSCGEMIERCAQTDEHAPIVATVFAGIPDFAFGVSDHDAYCGFKSSAEAIECRRGEDRIAGLVLGFVPRCLDLLELAYVDAPTPVETVCEAIRDLVESADVVFAPLGLQHPDHLVTADAAFYVARELDTQFVAYEEVPYRVEIPVETMDRIHAVGLLAIADCDVPPRGNLERKRLAVHCYSSQLPTLDLDGCFVRERFWRLHNWVDVRAD